MTASQLSGKRIWVAGHRGMVGQALVRRLARENVTLLTPDRQTLVRWGAQFGPLTTQGQWWRLFTCTFLHIGILHLLCNMVVLWQIGGILERLLGRSAFLVVYLLAGLAGSLASLAWNPDVVAVGGERAGAGQDHGGEPGHVEAHQGGAGPGGATGRPDEGF